MRTPRLPAVDWTDAPRRFKWTRPFRRKTKSSFCACAITFQTQSTVFCVQTRFCRLMFFSLLGCCILRVTLSTSCHFTSQRSAWPAPHVHHKDKQGPPEKFRPVKYSPSSTVKNVVSFTAPALNFELFLLFFSITRSPLSYFAFCPRRVFVRSVLQQTEIIIKQLCNGD